MVSNRALTSGDDDGPQCRTVRGREAIAGVNHGGGRVAREGPCFSLEILRSDLASWPFGGVREGNSFFS